MVSLSHTKLPFSKFRRWQKTNVTCPQERYFFFLNFLEYLDRMQVICQRRHIIHKLIVSLYFVRRYKAFCLVIYTSLVFFFSPGTQ
jgi:hypothetical protein